MAKYNAYPEYKDSDVGWLKKVPKHWKKITFKYLLEMMVDNRGRTPPTYDVGIPLLEAKQIDGSLKYTSTTFDKFIDEAGHSHFIRDDVRENDILFITVGTIGKTCLVPSDPNFVIAQNLVALRMIDDYSPVFMLFWLRSLAARESMLSTNKDSILDSIKISDFIQSRLYIPEFYEQEKIANFLDHETAQIDTLIDKQQTLIQLLKEKRQAVISHAVTKGLNPDVPMKDSGVEWLGEVPEHWEVSKLKYLISEPLQYGANEAAEDVDKTHPRFVRITDVLPNGNLKDDTFRSLPQDIAEPYMLMDGDVLLARSGGTVGKSFIYRDSWGKCCFAGYLIKAKIDENITPAEWFYLNTLTDFYWKWIESIQIQATIQNVSADKYNSFVIAVPPLEESYKIISHIKFNLEVFDTLVMKAEQTIQLMQERRTALISAAVTGKIDVRGWRVPE